MTYITYFVAKDGSCMMTEEVFEEVFQAVVPHWNMAKDDNEKLRELLVSEADKRGYVFIRDMEIIADAGIAMHAYQYVIATFRKS